MTHQMPGQMPGHYSGQSPGQMSPYMQSQMSPHIQPGSMGNPAVRQYTLEAAQGFPGSGIATISGEVQMFVVASLPQPSTYVNMPSAVYVTYLVDKKGQQGFAAGKMTTSREGVSQLSFRSPVPLSNYTRVVVSIEDPRKIQAYPQGPIVLTVKEDFRSRLTQGDFAKSAFDKAGSWAKRAGGFVKQKAGGFWSSRFGKSPPVPDPMIPAPGANAVSAAEMAGIAGVGAGAVIGTSVAAGSAGPSQEHMPLDPQTQGGHPQHTNPQMSYPQNPNLQNPNFQNPALQNPQNLNSNPQNLNSNPQYPISQNSGFSTPHHQSLPPQGSSPPHHNPQRYP